MAPPERLIEVGREDAWLRTFAACVTWQTAMPKSRTDIAIGCALSWQDVYDRISVTGEDQVIERRQALTSIKSGRFSLV
jgi:hypothetical protein